MNEIWLEPLPTSYTIPKRSIPTRFTMSAASCFPSILSIILHAYPSSAAVKSLTSCSWTFRRLEWDEDLRKGVLGG